ncbi:hypothetical protein ABG067_008007 [Albugo candida]
MKLFIFGGTSPTGQEMIKKALAQNHTVVAYVRSPQKLDQDIASKITVVQGELTDEAAILQALEGVDAVLSCLGPRIIGNPKGLPITNGYKLIVKCMEQKGVKRIIATATPSFADKENDKSAMFSSFLVGMIKTFVPQAYSEMNGIGETLTNSDLDWTIVRLYILTNGKEGVVKTAYVGDAGYFIARKDIAQFILNEVEQNQYIKKSPIIYST